MSGIVKLVRRAVGAIWVLLLAGLMLLVAVVQIGPLVGHDTYVIGGGSMVPAIPVGSLVIEERIDPADLRPGDIVTVRLHNSVVLTHRVVRTAHLPDGLHLELKGDANAAADPVLVPASILAGRMVVSLPLVGYLVTLIRMPIGILCVFAALASLYLLLLFLDDLEAALQEARRQRSVMTDSGLTA